MKYLDKKLGVLEKCGTFWVYFGKIYRKFSITVQSRFFKSPVFILTSNCRLLLWTCWKNFMEISKSYNNFIIKFLLLRNSTNFSTKMFIIRKSFRTQKAEFSRKFKPTISKTFQLFKHVIIFFVFNTYLEFR